MNIKHIIETVLISLIAYSSAVSQEQLLYKQVDNTKLFLEVYYPETINIEKKYPAIVFFFGGGWNAGSTKQFEPHAKYFSLRGMISILVDYRVTNRHQIRSLSQDNQ